MREEEEATKDKKSEPDFSMPLPFLILTPAVDSRLEQLSTEDVSKFKSYKKDNDDANPAEKPLTSGWSFCLYCKRTRV